MTCYHIEEMVNLIFIIHGDLGVACVAGDGVVVLLLAPCSFLFPAPLRFYRKLHFCVDFDGAVHDEHRPVLGSVHVVALTVET